MTSMKRPPMNSPVGLRSGLTLIEGLVAMAVLTVLLLAVIPSFTNNARINNRMEIKSGAVAAAQQALDSLRTQAIGWPESMTIDAGLRTYLVEIDICAAGSDDCYSSSNAHHVRLEVKHAGETYYEVETVYTRFD